MSLFNYSDIYNTMARIGRNPEHIDPQRQSLDRAKMIEMIARPIFQEISITMGGKTLCVIKEGEEEKPAKKKPKKRAPKKLSKKLDVFSEKVVNYCGENVCEENMAIHSKTAPNKGAKNGGEFVDPYKEFDKALARGKKNGAHLANKADSFLKEIDKLAGFDPLKGKI